MTDDEIYVIGDTQSKEGVKNPLIPYAHHIAELKPSYLMHLGDHWDMPSLSFYDKGKKKFADHSYLKDNKAGSFAMRQFFNLLDKLWPQHKKKCHKIILVGNHEERIDRAYQYGDNNMRDLIDEHPLCYKGWDEVIPFLKIRKLLGINFSHYFQQLKNASAIGTARQILMKKHKTCVAGHAQGFDYEEMMTDDGIIQAVILGSSYYHNEEYKPQSNHHFRGTMLLKNIKKGTFDFNRYSLASLTKKYMK